MRCRRSVRIREGEPDTRCTDGGKRHNRCSPAPPILRILEEADRCTEPGEVGRLLRREGLYSSHLTAWRKARRKGSLQGLTSKKRGAKPARAQPAGREGA